MILGFLHFVRVIVLTCELIKDRVDVVFITVMCSNELREDHGLDLAREIHVNVVKAGLYITDNRTIDSKLRPDGYVPCIKLVTYSGGFIM